jgi:hypothetical protein
VAFYWPAIEGRMRFKMEKRSDTLRTQVKSFRAWIEEHNCTLQKMQHEEETVIDKTENSKREEKAD